MKNIFFNLNEPVNELSVTFFSICNPCTVITNSSWKREIRVKKIEDRMKGETWYYTPCGRRMKQFPEIVKVFIFLKVVRNRKCPFLNY